MGSVHVGSSFGWGAQHEPARPSESASTRGCIKVLTYTYCIVCSCKVPTSRFIRIRGNRCAMGGWVRLRVTQRSYSHGAMLKSGVGVRLGAGRARAWLHMLKPGVGARLGARALGFMLKSGVGVRLGSQARAWLLLPEPDCEPRIAASCCSSGTHGPGALRCRRRYDCNCNWNKTAFRQRYADKRYLPSNEYCSAHIRHHALRSRYSALKAPAVQTRRVLSRVSGLRSLSR